VPTRLEGTGRLAEARGGDDREKKRLVSDRGDRDVVDFEDLSSWNCPCHCCCWNWRCVHRRHTSSMTPGRIAVIGGRIVVQVPVRIAIAAPQLAFGFWTVTKFATSFDHLWRTVFFMTAK